MYWFQYKEIVDSGIRYKFNTYHHFYETIDVATFLGKEIKK